MLIKEGHVDLCFQEMDTRKGLKQKRAFKRSNEKRFLKRVTRRIICLPSEHPNEEMLGESHSSTKISDNDRVTDISSKSCSSIEETCVHLQHQQPTANVLPTRGTNLGLLLIFVITELLYLSLIIFGLNHLE